MNFDNVRWILEPIDNGFILFEEFKNNPARSATMYFPTITEATGNLIARCATRKLSGQGELFPRQYTPRNPKE